ncbi:hypothetical protein ACLB1R_25365 [Escherichia coli]
MLVETDGETVFSSRGALATGMELLAERGSRPGSQQYCGTISNGAKAFSRHRKTRQGTRGQDELFA